MFKRALKTNHWMVLGLDRWNELENMEISLETIRKMRREARLAKESGSDEDSSDDLAIESESDLNSDSESILSDGGSSLDHVTQVEDVRTPDLSEATVLSESLAQEPNVESEVHEVGKEHEKTPCEPEPEVKKRVEAPAKIKAIPKVKAAKKRTHNHTESAADNRKARRAHLQTKRE